ncbi:hypothetical protein EYC59_04085 [Candidatus Saccharibacteria bacterium]|nr:MAG: hypothetical protein EYC59_04085 [Candidatus Saccharibacteria bacterium]
MAGTRSNHNSNGNFGDRRWAKLLTELQRKAAENPLPPADKPTLLRSQREPGAIALAQKRGDYVPRQRRVVLGRRILGESLPSEATVLRALVGSQKDAVLISANPRRDEVTYVGETDLYPGGYSAKPDAPKIVNRINEHGTPELKDRLAAPVTVPIVGVSFVPQNPSVEYGYDHRGQLTIKGTVWLHLEAERLAEERKQARAAGGIGPGRGQVGKLLMATLVGPRGMLSGERFKTGFENRLGRAMPPELEIGQFGELWQPQEPEAAFYPMPEPVDTRGLHRTDDDFERDFWANW